MFRGPFYQHGISLIPVWIGITRPIKFAIKFLSHSKTSMRESSEIVTTRWFLCYWRILFLCTLTPYWVNWLWTNDAIWRRRYVSALVQVMAWCLTAPRHYLKQCWNTLGEVLRYSPKSHVKAISNGFKNDTFETTATSTRGQWVKMMS